MTKNFARLAFASVMGAASFVQAEEMKPEAGYSVPASVICHTDYFKDNVKISNYCYAAAKLEDQYQQEQDECYRRYSDARMAISRKLPLLVTVDRQQNELEKYGQCQKDSTQVMQGKMNKLFEEKLGKGFSFKVSGP